MRMCRRALKELSPLFTELTFGESRYAWLPRRARRARHGASLSRAKVIHSIHSRTVVNDSAGPAGRYPTRDSFPIGVPPERQRDHRNDPHPVVDDIEGPPIAHAPTPGLRTIIPEKSCLRMIPGRTPEERIHISVELGGEARALGGGGRREVLEEGRGLEDPVISQSCGRDGLSRRARPRGCAASAAHRAGSHALLPR